MYHYDSKTVHTAFTPVVTFQPLDSQNDVGGANIVLTHLGVFLFFVP